MEKRKRKKHPSLVTAGSVGVTSTTGGDGSSGKDARSVLGRALITILPSLASEALTRRDRTIPSPPVGTESTTTTQPPKSHKWIRRAMWSSLITLEMVVSFQTITPLPSPPTTTGAARRSSTATGGAGGEAKKHHMPLHYDHSHPQGRHRPTSTFVAASSLLTIGDVRRHVHAERKGGGGNVKEGRLTQVWNDVVLRSIYADTEMVAPVVREVDAGSGVEEDGLVRVCPFIFKVLYPTTGGGASEAAGDTNDDDDNGDILPLWNRILSSSSPISIEDNAAFTESVLQHPPHGKINHENNEPNTTSEYDPVMEDMINTMVMDGSRVSIRRWASMVFVWMYGGQSKVLEIVRNVLSHGEGGTTAHRHWWEDVMTTTITPASTFYSSYNNHNSLAATAEYRTTARLTSYVLPTALRMADRINLPNIPLTPPTLLSSPPPPRVSDFMAV